MKSYIFRILVVLLFSVSINSFSQDNVVVTEMSNETKSDYSKSRQSIKINPLLFARGDMPIYFEKSIYNNLALEAGVGITLQDYVVNIFDDIVWDNNSQIGINRKIGYSYRLGLRYYASDYNFESEGMYFEIIYRSQLYGATLDKVGELTNLSNDLKHVNNDVLFTLGFVQIFDENAFIDPFIGFGIRRRNYDTISFETVNSTTTYSIVNENDVVPTLTLGVKFGILF